MRTFAQRTSVQALFLFLVAFVPLAIPSAAMQIDEVAHWYDRTDRFLRAMRDGRFADTVQTEHPGITTVAFGGLGRLALEQIDPERALPFVTQMQVLRFPVGVVNALVVPLAFLVLVRLFDVRVAFLGVLMWATAPYLRWYTRLLHIDGMSTTFMMLSFALMLLAWRLHVSPTQADKRKPAPVGWGWLALAGFVAGLASLTRFSSFYLAGMAGVLALINLWTYRRQLTVQGFLTQIALPVLVFTGVLALTWTALYPGMWANADAVWGEFIHGFDNALNPHDNGSFFMGEPRQDPGFWYYPVALPFRMTPWTLLGLPLALLAALRGEMRSQWRLWLAVALYAVLYLAILVWQGKKFDRYALPIFPALHLLAAFGWLWLVGIIGKHLGSAPPWRSTAGWVAVTVLLVVNGMWFLRGEYAYMNPLLGGARAPVEEMLIIGNGEGFEGVAAYFQGEIDDEALCTLRISTFYEVMLQRYLPCTNISDLDPGEFTEKADYIVNYINYRQRFPELQPFMEDATPIHVVQVHGIAYAYIYDTAQWRQTAQAE